MAAIQRLFWIVLDSVGIGEAPDAAEFGDTGAFTLRSVHQTRRLHIPNLLSMGLGSIDGLSFLGTEAAPSAAVARLREASRGKDTTVGHWELAGHISHAPLPTFPNGFPKEWLDRFSQRVGRGVLCNRPYSGTAVIRDYGEEHLKTGNLIVYTSADSVLQIAAHTELVPLSELYEICQTARETLTGAWGVGRVIARPFAGSAPDFYRTSDRRDFSLEPPVPLLPDAVLGADLDCFAVGKIADIFARRGFSEAYPTHSNEEGMQRVSELAKNDFHGLCFVNLVDFDMLWGHRRDALAYAEGLSRFDAWLGDFLQTLRANDALMITADHGCDPAFMRSTDHTREYAPLLLYGKRICPVNFQTRPTFADAGATAAALLGVDFSGDGTALDLIFS